MSECYTEVATASARRYLQQLCKHWSHRFRVESTDDRGFIELPLGHCALYADDNRLSIRIAADEASHLPQFRGVLEEHLQRFAFRESLTFAWQEGGAGDQ